MLVSVAVITYNMECYLEQLLDSILEQTVSFEYEIVICDDCSPDRSRELIQSYEKRFPDIVHPIYCGENAGGSKNMFRVMEKCRGKYIAILEGDDWWEDKEKLQYQTDFLESHPEYVGMCCNSWCDHGKEAEYRDLMRCRDRPKEYSLEDFMKRHFHDRLPSSTDTWLFRNFWHDGGDYSVFYKAHKMVWDQALALILYVKGMVYADTRIVSHHRSISKGDGTNYQSLITQKNCLYEDSRMYQALEGYMEDILGKACKPFYIVRGDVWIDAVFRAIKSKKKEDWQISWKIWKDQPRKGMLMKMFCMKTVNIIRRKISLCVA